MKWLGYIFKSSTPGDGSQSHHTAWSWPWAKDAAPQSESDCIAAYKADKQWFDSLSPERRAQCELAYLKESIERARIAEELVNIRMNELERRERTAGANTTSN